MQDANEDKRKRLYVPSSNEKIPDYNPAQINLDNLPEFPTKSGVTEKDAIDLCTKAIEHSTFGKVCLDMYPEMDFSVVIEECVTDIKVCCSSVLWLVLRPFNCRPFLKKFAIFGFSAC